MIRTSVSAWALALLTLTLASWQARAEQLQAIGASGPLRTCSGPTQLLWSGGVGQTDVAVTDEDGKLVQSFERQPADTYSVTWYPVNATAGKRVFLVTADESGQTSRSDAMVVQDGQSTDVCQPANDAALPSFTLFSGAPSSTVQSASSAALMSTSTITSPSGTTTTTTTGQAPTGSSGNNSSSTSDSLTPTAPTFSPSSGQMDSALSILHAPMHVFLFSLASVVTCFVLL